MSEPDSRAPVVRASDAERDAVLVQLREAAGEGRLGLEELAERIDGALGAVTREDLVPLTADLPAQGTPAPSGAKASDWVVSVMGGNDRKGRWRIAARCNVVNFMGGSDLDLTDAMVAGQETEIRVFSMWGGSTIRIPDGVHVDFGGFAFMGGNELKLEGAPAPPVGAPVVRVRAYSLMAGTDVERARR